MDLRVLIVPYLIGFWDRRWSIFAVAWAVSLIGWIVVATLPDRYTSSAQVFIDTQSLLTPLMKGLAVTPDAARQVEIVRRTLLSRPNLKQLARMTDLDLTVDSEIEEQQLLNSIAGRLNVGFNRGLFHIAYTDTNPQRAPRVVQALLDIFIEQNIGHSRRDMEESQRFLDLQIREYERQLREAEAQLAAFRRENADALARQSNALGKLQSAQAELRRLESEREAAVWGREQLQARLGSVPQTIERDDAALDGSESPEARRVVDLRRQLDQLLLVYTDRHPDVIATNRLLEAAEADLEEANAAAGPGAGSGMFVNPAYTQIQQQIAVAEQSISALEWRISQAARRIDETRAQAQAAPEMEVQRAQMNRDYEILQANYQTLIQRREAARLGERLDTETDSVQFRVVEPPIVPIRPSGPDRPLLFAAAVAAGLAVGFGIALLRMVLNPAITTVTELRERFGIPVLGCVSLAVDAAGVRRRAAEAATLAGGTVVLVGACALLSVMDYKLGMAGLPQVLQDLGERVGSFL